MAQVNQSVQQSSKQPLSQQPQQSKDYLKVSVIWHHFTGAANFEIEAKQVSTKNNLGPFDILPGHANLIGIVTESISLTKTSGQTEFYFFTRGIIEVAQNNVKLFLEGKID